MRVVKASLIGVMALAAVASAAENPPRAELVEQPEWARFFSDVGVEGTIVVARGSSGPLRVHNTTRARAQFLPASTFKIPHTLFALDAGVVRDSSQVFRWDGVKREMDAWNRDQTLSSAMRNSVVIL